MLLRQEMHRDIKHLHEELVVPHRELQGLRKAANHQDP
jgi:hypothetical protein